MKTRCKKLRVENEEKVEVEKPHEVQRDIVIGVLSQCVSKGGILKKYPEINGKPYIATSYQQFVESANAKVLLINFNVTEEKAVNIYESIHGLILPGGAASLKCSNYSKVATLFQQWSKRDSIEKKRYFPIFGICLGFQYFLRHYENEGSNCLSETCTRDYNLNLNFTNDYRNSKMFKDLSSEIYETFTKKEATFNYHRFSMEASYWKDHSNISEVFRILATSVDPKTGVEFIAAYEAKDYPFYGVQWHPEKNAHEEHEVVSHTEESILASKHFIDFLVQEASKEEYKPRVNFTELTEETKLFDTHDVMIIKTIHVFET